MSEKRIKAWHFISEGKTLGYGDGRTVKIGKIYSCKGKPDLCEHGMHGSKRIIDALGYSPGPIICRVEIWGDLVFGNDKLCGRHRKVLSMIDATGILHEFTCRCAEDSIALDKNPDPRSIAAIRAKRDWMKGKISDEELSAARAASWIAVRIAVRNATRAAVRDAAWAASWAAVRISIRDAARCVASGAQNRRLTSMVVAAMKKGR